MLSSAQNCLSFHLGMSRMVLTIADLGDVRIVHEGVSSMFSYCISNVDDCLLFFDT